jgi:hypothetical protein
MIVFRNPGLIDLEAVRNLGVSVKLEGSFGRFGTGLKFAIANILRNGGAIRIFRGHEEHRLSTEPLTIRDVEHQIVALDGQRIGFAVTFGKDWEPWMVLRELGCNALDEHGDFFKVSADGETGKISCDRYIDCQQTVISVEWDALDTAYDQRGELFLEGTPLWQTPSLRVLKGPSAHLFYRGVRVYKLEKPSLFTYDILKEQILTEDRTLASSYSADALIRDAWIAVESKELARQSLGAGENYYEGKIDYDVYAVKHATPSRVWIEAGVELRKEEKLGNASAKPILGRYVRRFKAEEESTFGSYRRVVEDGFSYALEQLDSLGVKFTEEQQRFITLDELEEDDALSMVEEGRIYVLKELQQRPAREIMIELTRRWVDVNGGLFAAADLLIPLLVGRSKDLKMDEALVKEDEVLDALVPAEEAPKLTDSWEPLDEARGRIIPDLSHGYVVEGEWSRNSKIVHRQCITKEEAKLLEHQRHHFADGTQLIFNVRKLMDGESVQEKQGYASLAEEFMTQQRKEQKKAANAETKE